MKETQKTIQEWTNSVSTEKARVDGVRTEIARLHDQITQFIRDVSGHGTRLDSMKADMDKQFAGLEQNRNKFWDRFWSVISPFLAAFASALLTYFALKPR